MVGQRLSEDQRRQITAAFFRREPYPQICQAHGVSDRNLRRIASCLSTYGTTVSPRRDLVKPMGRPQTIKPELLEELYTYVEEHPIATLREINPHLATKFDARYGRGTEDEELESADGADEADAGDIIHDGDTSGQAYAVQHPAPGGDTLAQIHGSHGPLPASTPLDPISQQIAPHPSSIQ